MIEVTFEGPGQVRRRAVRPRAGLRRPAAEQPRDRPGEHAGPSRPAGLRGLRRQPRTAEDHILAIGDVAGEPMLAHKATHEAKVAVEALLGKPAEFDKLAIPAVVFTDPEIAWAGLDGGAGQARGPRGRPWPCIPGRPAAGPRRWAAPKA